MTTPERIWAWSKETTDRDNYPITETGWEEDDHNAKWYADWGIPFTGYIRADVIDAIVAARLEKAMMVIASADTLDGVRLSAQAKRRIYSDVAKHIHSLITQPETEALAEVRKQARIEGMRLATESIREVKS